MFGYKDERPTTGDREDDDDDEAATLWRWWWLRWIERNDRVVATFVMADPHPTIMTLPM